MPGLLTGEVIVSPEILLVMAVLVAAGTAIVYIIANRKWGYTGKREKELEEADFSGKYRK